jgi:hypothetical protein
MYISEDRSLVEKDQIVLYILFQNISLGILFQQLGHSLQLVWAKELLVDVTKA